MPIKKDEEMLKNNSPHIVVGTPGRLLALGRSNQLKLKSIKFFVLDECDKMIGDAGQLLSGGDIIKLRALFIYTQISQRRMLTF